MTRKALMLSGLVLSLVATLAACARKSKGESVSVSGAKIRIVTTIFATCDWVMNIIGENPAEIEVECLSDGGVDFHSYQPTARDILELSSCNLLIRIGGKSDRWTEDTLEGATGGGAAVVNLLDLLAGNAKKEEFVEGMELGNDSDESDADEWDEHVWLSLKNAMHLMPAICDAICQIDPENASLYESNTANYAKKLESLDAEYQKAVDEAHFRTLLFADRFPFRYLTDDYKLNYYAAFPGCSAESEASFKTVAFLSQKADELFLPAVITIDGSDHKIAEAIVRNTQKKNQKALMLDSMQSLGGNDIGKDVSYLSIMEKNLSVLKSALE